MESPKDTSCWTCGGSPHASGLVCICGGTGSHNEEVFGLRDLAAKYNYVKELLRDVKTYVDANYPDSAPQMFERDEILRRVNKVLSSNFNPYMP